MQIQNYEKADEVRFVIQPLPHHAYQVEVDPKTMENLPFLFNFLHHLIANSSRMENTIKLDSYTYYFYLPDPRRWYCSTYVIVIYIV